MAQYQVTLSDAHRDLAKAEGDGNLSLGLRDIIKEWSKLRGGHAPTQTHHKTQGRNPALDSLGELWNVDEPAPIDPRNPSGHKGTAERLRKADEEAARKASLPELQLRSHIRACLTQDLGERWMQSALEAAEMPMVQARAILADVLANESEAIAEERAVFRARVAAHDKKMKDAENLYKQRVANGMDAQQALIQGTHELGLKTAAEQAASEPSYAEWLKANPIQTEDDEDVTSI